MIWSEHFLYQSSNPNMKAKENHLRSSGTTTPEAAVLAEFKKKGSNFLLLSNSSILIFILITAQQILEIKQLTSRIPSTKIWELIKMEVTENQTTEPWGFDSPLWKLHGDINGLTEINIHQPARRRIVLELVEIRKWWRWRGEKQMYATLNLGSSASTVNSYSSRIISKKILNRIVVVDVDSVNARMIVECKSFSWIDNKLQGEACSNGGLSFGVGWRNGEYEVRKVECDVCRMFQLITA